MALRRGSVLVACETYVNCYGCAETKPVHLATHEAWVLERWRPYCCAVFDHDWPEQRLIEGRACEKKLVIETATQRVRRWIWRKRTQTK